jgi:YidC/Oxa1 family membrane protein insertase
MLWVFKFLETFIPSYGLIIFILAVIIRLITLYPTHWAYLSGAKMQVVNKMPEMKELDQQYADDPTTLQQKKMAFYNEVGVNPLGGCIPLLLQLPVLFAMFVFFPHSIELRQQPFLWADDLSTYDSILDFGFNIPFYGDHVSLFCLLMTATTMVMTYIQQQQQGSAAQQPGMKYLVYIMPIMFLSILNNYSAGLSYYQLVSNILSLVQTQLTKRFIKEEDIQKKIRENFEKRKKEGVTGKKTWMQRQLEAQQQALEEARKKQPPPPNPRRFK